MFVFIQFQVEVTIKLCGYSLIDKLQPVCRKHGNVNVYIEITIKHKMALIVKPISGVQNRCSKING